MFNIDEYNNVIESMDKDLLNLLGRIYNEKLNILNLSNEEKTLITENFYVFYSKLYGLKFGERYMDCLNSPILFIQNVLNYLYLERQHKKFQCEELIYSDIDTLINDIINYSSSYGVSESMIIGLQFDNHFKKVLNGFK